MANNTVFFENQAYVKHIYCKGILFCVVSVLGIPTWPWVQKWHRASQIPVLNSKQILIAAFALFPVMLVLVLVLVYVDNLPVFTAASYTLEAPTKSKDNSDDICLLTF